MVGGATVLGVGRSEELIDPRQAAEGDRIVITKGPAVETTGLMSVQFPEFIEERLGTEAVSEAQDVFFQMSVVEDAAVCAEVGGVTAMHDATECGIWGALFEMARASGRGLTVDKSSIVTQEIVLNTCEVFGIDPYSSISEGTLVASVSPGSVDAVLGALASRSIPASVVGELGPKGSDVVVTDESGEHPLVHPEVDPFWGTFEEYLQKQSRNT
jgi:hydrogenase maturation factor